MIFTAPAGYEDVPSAEVPVDRLYEILKATAIATGRRYFRPNGEIVDPVAGLENSILPGAREKRFGDVEQSIRNGTVRAIVLDISRGQVTIEDGEREIAALLAAGEKFVKVYPDKKDKGNADRLDEILKVLNGG